MTRQKPKPQKSGKVKTVTKKDYTSYWLIAGLLLTLVVYFPSLFNGITNWDDLEYVNNPYVKNLSPAGIAKIFSVYFFGNYHPLTLLSLGTDRLIGGDRPFVFHFTNLFLHLLNTFLVFLLVRRLTQNNLPAIITCILFGVHTLHVESVAWVAERKDVLYTFFYLLSLILYTSYASGRKGLHYGLSLLFFLLSLLSKGQAVVLVVLLPFIDYMKGRKWFSLKVLSEKIPFFLLSLVFGWIAFRAQEYGNALNTAYVPLPERFAFASFGFAQYLIKGILPIGLSALYPYPPGLVNGSIPLFYWLFLISIPAFLAGSYFLFRRSKIYAFGLSMFFLNLLPVLQLIPVGGAIMADRYFYVPSIGLLLCFACGLLEIRKSRTRYALVALYLLVLSFLSFSRCMVWKDSITLWDDVIGKYNRAKDAYYNRGIAFKSMEQWDKAIADFSRVIELDPEYKNAYTSRGLAFGNTGEYDKAIADFSKLLEFDPASAEGFYNRGVTYINLGQWDKAIADQSKVIAIDPGYKDAYFNRGNGYRNLGQWEKAIADYSAAIRLDPDYKMAYFNRGIAYGNAGQIDKELADYGKVIGIDPKNTDAYYNRSICYINLGQWEKAIAECSSVIAIDPGYTRAWSNRGVAYWNLGQRDKALADYSKAIEMDPNYTDAYFNRGLAYASLGQWEKAIADYSKVIELNPDFTMAYTNRDVAYRKLLQEKKR